MPTVGEVLNGFTFQGGNPKDANSWKKIESDLKVGQVVNGYTYRGGEPKDSNSWEEEKKNIIQEMHPDLNMTDRPKLKNFANSPESSLAYLKEQHPGMDIQNYAGQIIMRNPGEKEYKVLDPDTGFWSKDFLHDAGDVAYDVASGIPVNAIQKLGGALGMVTPVPGATLAGAAAAGGTANAGNEYMRQKIGKMLGIPQEVNMDDVKMAGAIGAVSPVVFGNDLASPAVRDSIKSGVQKLPQFMQKFIKPVGEDKAKRLSEGLLKRGAVGAASVASGIPGETLREGFKRLTTIKNFEKYGTVDYVDDVHKDIADSLNAAKQTAGKEIQTAIEKSGGKVDLASSKSKIQNLITEYEGKIKDLDTPEMRDKLDQVKDTFKQVFGEDIPDKVVQTPTGMLDQYGKPLMKTTVTKGKVAPTQVNALSAFELQQQLSDLADVHHTTQGVVGRGAGKSVADKRLGSAANEAYREIKDSLEKAIDKASNSPGHMKELKDKYRDLMLISKEIGPKFSTPERTYNSLRSLEGKNKQYFFETLEKMDKEMGTDTLEHAKDLHVFSLFSKAPTNPVSNAGVTSTSKTIPMAAAGGSLGYFLGANSGLGMGGAGLGMGAGAFIGSKMASPAMMRRAMEAGTVGSKALKYVPDSTKQSVWNMMMNRQNMESR